MAFFNGEKLQSFQPALSKMLFQKEVVVWFTSLNQPCSLPIQNVQTRFGIFGLIDCIYYWNRLWCQELNLTRVWRGSAAMRSAATMRHAQQLSCQMLKMGSSGHSGSTQGVNALEGGWSRWFKAHWERPDVIRLLRWGWAPPLCSIGCLSISRTSSREIIGATSVTPLCL